MRVAGTTHGATGRGTAAGGRDTLRCQRHRGPAAVPRLRRMFAFLIWDSQLRVAFGARDPFGIKPLFSCSGPAGMAFASEKKSLLELAPSLGVSTELDRRAPQH